MSVNQQKKAENLAKARAKARERRKHRDQWQSQWARHYRELDESTDGSPFDELPFRGNPAARFGYRKMSEVLLELIDPLISSDGDSSHLLALAKIGMIAWNLTVTPKSEQSGKIDIALRTAPRDVKYVLTALMERKLALFPDDDRFIVDVFLNSRPNGDKSLQAMSAIPPREIR